MKLLLTLLVSIAVSGLFAQDLGFPFGQINYKHFEQPVLPRDSSANALVIKEFGEAHITNENKLMFTHHYIIKILKQEGVEEANIEIPLTKSGLTTEKLFSVKAASYNKGITGIQSSALNNKNVYTENRSLYIDLKKFTLPNVRVGSIIEVLYAIESPFFVRNFRQWEFQSNLPKVESEYWATIPGNYNYNMSLKGYLKLTKNESVIVNDCFDLGGGAIADCARYKYGMKNVPAFVEEDYMTASSNFIASINFELLEIKHFTGKVDKVTNEWKDTDDELRRDPNFGGQLKKGKDIFQKIEPQLAGVTDSLEKAKKIYDFIKTWYKWNEYYGKWSEGIKKAFEAKTGSVGDINLSLIAAIRSADLDVEAVLLSTRDNGLVTELWPVVSDFNYVVAKLNIGNKVFLLDATDPFLSFGMLHERCLNGKGRVFSDKKPSYWYDLKPTKKSKVFTILNLNLTPEGLFTGSVQIKSEGYRAFDKQKQIASFTTQEDYIASLKKGLDETIIKNYEITHGEDLNPSVIEKFDVEIPAFDDLNAENLLFNPFLTGKIKNNPFRSNERLYPVDFGAPEETSVVLHLSYPPTIELESVPDNAALTLPGSGGKFLFETISLQNKISVNYLLAINKPVFNSSEYSALKELYNRVIDTQKTDILFKKKK